MSTEQDKQGNIDREQMIAGLEAGKALIDMARLNPNGLDAKAREDLEKQVKKLVIPERLKTLSADGLRKMIVDDYIEEASIGILGNKGQRGYRLNFDLKHTDLVQSVADVFISRGYKIELFNPTALNISW